MVMPMVVLDRLPESFVDGAINSERRARRKRGKRNRRMFFNRIKQHGPNAPRYTRKRIESGDMVGFPSERQNSDDSPFYGFDDESACMSYLKSMYMKAVLDESFLQVADEPVKCMSIGIQNAGTFHVMTVVPMPRRPIRVLSLFDGLASGLLVLSLKLGIKVDVYYSSEVDADALIVQRRRHFGKLIGLGDVRSVTYELLDALGGIDLLLGGSPCDQLSLVNPRRTGLNDEKSTGSLFFNFVRIRNYLSQKALREGTQFFWFFENTSQMEVATRETMNKALGCEPVMACSSAFLPVVRRRLFWGNTPFLEDIAKSMRQKSRETEMEDIIGPDRVPVVQVFPTITTNGSGKGKIRAVCANGKQETLDITDYEKLLGFPASYTDVGKLSFCRRLRLLGKAWCLDVVKELLMPLTEVFQVENRSGTGVSG